MNRYRKSWFPIALCLASFAAACSGEQLLTRAAYDLQCPEADLEVTELDELSRGVRGCGQQVTYVKGCQAHHCTWILNSDSRPALDAAPAKSTEENSSTSAASEEQSEKNSEVMYSNLAPEQPFPNDAAGFQFSSSPEEARAACEAGGHEWTDTDTGAACSGLPKDVGVPGKSQVRFCGGKLCRLGVAIEVDQGNLSVPIGIWTSLNKKYGKPVKSHTKVPNSCREAMYECIASGEAVMNNLWRWNQDQKITAKFEKKGDDVYLLLYYVLPMTEVPDKGKGAAPPPDYTDTF